MTTTTKNTVYYYKARANKTFRWSLIILIIIKIGLKIVSGNDIFHLSSFINHPQDFPLPFNEWAFKCGDVDFRSWLVNIYFGLDFFFPVFLALIILFLIKGVNDSIIEPDSKSRIFDFSIRRPFKLNKASRIAFYFLIPAILFDWFENSLLLDTLAIGEIGNVSTSLYTPISTIKLVLFIIPVVLMLGSFIYTYWLDFGSLWKKFLPRFYPSILGVGFTFLVFTFFGQAYDFVVELTEPGNLLLFMLIFPLALIGLWLVPYYLHYTRKLPFQDMKFRQILFYTVNTMKKVGKKKSTVEERYQSLFHSEEGFFHKVRRSIALGFIIAFLLILMNLIVDMTGLNAAISGLVMLVNFAGIYYITYRFRKAKHKDVDELEIHKEEASILTDYTLNEKSQLYKLTTLFFSLVTFNFVIALFHITLCIIPESGHPLSMFNPGLMTRLMMFALHAFLLSWSFLIYALYRKIELNAGDINNSWQRNIYSFFKTASYTPTLIKWFFGISAGLFVLIAIIVMSDVHWIEAINPLNLFLIILNFIIAAIAFLDRVIIATMKSEVIDLGPRVGGVVFVAVVLFLFAINSQENHYHDLHRVEVEQEDLDYIDLQEYTQRFLDNSSRDTAYFIAADGGGLKAAFWTMNLLHDMQNRDPDFFENVYLTTGASGGMVGLGMYTYMYSQSYNHDEISNMINTLGATNFLNNDLAGLAIKSPLVSLCPPLANVIADRTAAMSHRYFQLTSESDDQFQDVLTKPFAHIWQERNYEKLPLLVVNTTKTEDGSRGIIHPLMQSQGDALVGPFTDLTDLTIKHDKVDAAVSLTLPDGLFTTNRFPIFSPYARVEGKGHFVDGGYLENSGLSTVMHFLNHMKLSSDTASVYNNFFSQKKIIVISIGNDQTSYVKNSVGPKVTNKSGSTGAISAILGAVYGGGLSALPSYYDFLFESLENPSNPFSLNVDFVKIDMPFPFDIDDINAKYKGQVPDCNLSQLAEEKTQVILDRITNRKCNICPGKNPYYLTPPLGRFMSKPSRDYMRDMVAHETVRDSILKVVGR